MLLRVTGHRVLDEKVIEAGRLFRWTVTAIVLGWVYCVNPDPRLLRHRGSGASVMAKAKRLTVTSGPRLPAVRPDS